MPAVVTVTFSPCIDKNISVGELIPDHKLRCPPPELHPGGGGINVARMIHRFGEDVLAIYPSGSYTGECLNDMMRSDGVPFLTISSPLATRENIIISETSSNKQFRLGAPGVPLSSPEYEATINEVESAGSFKYLVVSGSFPPGVDKNAITRLSAIAHKHNAKLIVDTKGEPLKEAAAVDTFLIKPNIGELAWLAGREFISDNEIENTAAEILATGKCEVIVASMGERGAALVKRGYSKRITAPTVQHKSTVGAGDSMVAGIIISLLKGNTITDAVTFGVACGTATTLQEGSRLCEPGDAYRIFQSMTRSLSHNQFT